MQGLIFIFNLILFYQMSHFLDAAKIGTKRSSKCTRRFFCSSSNEDITNNIDFELLDDVSSLALNVDTSEGDDQGIYMNIYLFKKLIKHSSYLHNS